MRRVIALAVAAVVIAACSGPDESVRLTLDVERIGNELRVHGVTDLPDGAVLYCGAVHSLWSTAGLLPDDSLIVDTRCTVADGRYSLVANITTWPDGDASVWVVFQPLSFDQPAAVIDRYGDRGEHLAGDNVTKSGAGRKVEVERTVQVGVAPGTVASAPTTNPPADLPITCSEGGVSYRVTVALIFAVIADLSDQIGTATSQLDIEESIRLFGEIEEAFISLGGQPVPPGYEEIDALLVEASVIGAEASVAGEEGVASLDAATIEHATELMEAVSAPVSEATTLLQQLPECP